MRLALMWGAALLAFSFARTYLVALPLLFMAGFFELSFSSMAQTLVQMNAPETIRGRVLGLFNMSAAGLRTFSGLTVGLAGSITTIHKSLAASASAFIVVVGIILARGRRQPGPPGQPGDHRVAVRLSSAGSRSRSVRGRAWPRRRV